MNVRVVERHDDERGMFLVLFALLLVALVTMVGVVVDLGALREDRRLSRSTTDSAATSGAFTLTSAAGSPLAACEVAWAYVVQNLELPASSPSPCASSFPPSAVCVPTASPPPASATIGDYAISIQTPVLDNDPVFMKGESMGGDPDQALDADVDGTDPCDRLGVRIRYTRDPFFARIVGAKAATTDIHSVALRSNDNLRIPISLIIMEPNGCPAISASGNGSIEVVPNPAAPTLQGGIVAISQGSPSTCKNPTPYVLDVGTGSTNGHIAVKTRDGPVVDGAPTGPFNGNIFLRSMTGPICSGTACDPTQFSIATGYFPLPKRPPVNVDRGLVDYVYNCREVYSSTAPSDPNYRNAHRFGTTGQTLPKCEGENVTSPESDYMNEFYRAITASKALEPTTYTEIGPPCALPATSASSPFVGNLRVNCNPPNGFSLFVNGTAWFSGNTQLTPSTIVVNGNAIFHSGIRLGTGESVTVRGNTEFRGGEVVVSGGGAFTLRGQDDAISCSASQFVLTPVTCTQDSSRNAALAFFAAGSAGLKQQGGTVTMEHVMAYADDGPVINLGGGGSITWSPPTEGPFTNLALWSDKIGASNAQHSLTGGGTVSLAGVYFSPTGWFEIGGNSDIAPQRAQFWTSVLQQTGTATFNMTPDNSFVDVPVGLGTTLIR